MCLLPVGKAYGLHGLENGLFDFFGSEVDLLAVAFYDPAEMGSSIHSDKFLRVDVQKMDAPGMK